MAYPAKDYFLGVLLDVMANGQFSVDLTLMVKGVIVSGTPISETEYFMALGDSFLAGFENATFQHASPSPSSSREQLSALGGIVRNFLIEVGEDTLKARKQREEKLEALERVPDDAVMSREQVDVRDQLTRSYIFLKDVTIVCGQSQLLTLSLWRGRLSEIDGWSHGRFGA